MRLFHLVHILCIISLSYANYGDPASNGNTNLGIGPASFRSGSQVYVFGGELNDLPIDQMNITIFSIDTISKDPQVESTLVNPAGFECKFCNGFVFNDSYVLLYTGYSNVKPLVDNMGFMIYNPSTNTMTRPEGYKILPGTPPARYHQSSVITPDQSAVYIFGGIGIAQNGSLDMPIVRFDIATSTFSSYTNFTILGATATMLPSGVVVLAFGASNFSSVLYDTSQVFLYDTRTNTMTNQPVSGTPPVNRAEATGTLGPDNECIYYFGGNDFNVTFSITDVKPDRTMAKAFSDVVVLNTTSWTWYIPKLTGPPSSARFGAFSLLYTDNSLIIGGGGFSNRYLKDISVLRNLPLPGQSIESTNLQWFTHSYLDDIYSIDNGLSGGAAAGIIVAVIVFVIIIIVVLWRFVPHFKKGVNYIQTEVIWKPRSGEPLWAESSRLIVRFILFVFFVAFIVYSIYRAVGSPSQLQIETNIVNNMPIPDIRICSQSFSNVAPSPFNIICTLSNGTDCSGMFYPIDRDDFDPIFNSVSQPRCQLFVPQPGLAFQPNPGTYTTQFAESMIIKVISQNTAEPIAMYITYYSPGYDPNRIVYGISPENEKLSLDEVNTWMNQEKVSHLIPNTFGANTYTYTTATYSLAVSERLTDNGWNNIGFAYQRTSKLELTQHVGPLVQQPAATTVNKTEILQLTVKPNEFEIDVTREIKSSTILNGFAQAGGVFGLFVAIQTLLFGFRPDSPWGLVHRWSFGRLKRALANQLTSQFDKLKTPVPIVNPVHDRFYLKPMRSNTFLLESAPFIPNNREEDTDGARIKKMEERLQLMELLFKSYYINDEVFRHLDVAIKDNERRRSIAEEKVISSDGSFAPTDDEMPMRQNNPERMELPITSNDNT